MVDQQLSTQINSESESTLNVPRQFQVLLINDDFTPMDFVVTVLEKYFSMNRIQATKIMLKVHTEGQAVCGVFARDVAETKVSQVNNYARENQHPLLCVMKKV